MTNKIITASALGFSLLASSQAGAVSMLIGDVDGFGFTDTSTLLSAQGTAADTNGNGIIEAGEFLPDLDGDGHLREFGHDEFDNRSLAEASDTNGAQWTDISLENGYKNLGWSPANNASFNFTFAVPELGDIDFGVDHFINLIFGDYDVSPASIYVDGTKVDLTKQTATEDGLVQLAYAAVSWADMLDGEVLIDVYAPNEPFVAIDYAYLHTDATAAPIPVPAALWLMGLGLVALGYSRRNPTLKRVNQG